MRLSAVSTFTKIMGIPMLTLAVSAGAVFLYLLPFFEGRLMEGRVRGSSDLVDVAVSVARSYHEAAEGGSLEEGEARRLAMAQIKALRFGEDDYFWINDLDGVMLMHPLLPRLEGQSVMDERDERGAYYMREVVEAARSRGQGYVEYVWPKPVSLEPAPKISYVKLFEPWGWVIGGGIYVDDVQREIAIMHRNVLGIGLAALVLLLGLAYFMAKAITGPIGLATGIADRLARGELPDVPPSERRDEPGRLLSAMGAMVQTQRDKAEKAEAISRGDLTVEVRACSEKDVLGQALARMIASLRAQMGEVNEGVSVLAASAAEIATLVNQLAANSMETTVSIDETVTTVEELRQTSTVAAAKAGDVSDNARRNADVAAAGLGATREAVLGMEDIRAKMDTISRSTQALVENARTAQEIVDSVNELADQSNLLAVNASIEAAKVERGAEGFAVVAAEMRALAEESKRSAARVRKLLVEMRASAERAAQAMESGLQSVGRGVERTTAAGTAIRSLAESISGNAQAAAQIAMVCRQQLEGVDQVLSAVQSIRDANTQNSQAANSLRAEAAGLESLGWRLKELAGRYVVRKG